MVESLAMGKKYAVPHKLSKSKNGSQADENIKLKKEVISTYGTTTYEKKNITINPEDIRLQNYINI